ncbi:hypothetical protein [Pseudokineococcus sp. 1T1Z-3]|uniref:hypothetical protein n=1 Tax=Pseudokineococcus sp. 1T1Z-3 TaxID=3132745 RepID=UPI003096E15D
MSRDAVGRAAGGPDPARPGPADLDDETPGAAGSVAGGGRRRQALAGLAGLLLLVGGFAVGQRAGDPAAAPASVGRPAVTDVPRPDGFAVHTPDVGAPTASRLVVSWSRAQGLGGRQVVVLVAVDERTEVDVRLAVGDERRDGAGPGTDPGVDADSSPGRWPAPTALVEPAADRSDLGGPTRGVGDERYAVAPAVATAVLAAAGEDPAGGTALVGVAGSASGYVVLELRGDDSPFLGTRTAPRVHLAVVEGTEVLHLLAVPVVSRRDAWAAPPEPATGTSTAPALVG